MTPKRIFNRKNSIFKLDRLKICGQRENSSHFTFLRNFFLIKMTNPIPSLFGLQVITLVGLVSLVSADVNEIVGQNQYLPPSKGYNYDRPSVPFPSSPASRPTPSYQQPQSSYQPPSQRPTYQPSTPSYQPPAPSYGPPTPTRPPAPRPTVGYPTGPSGYQPGTAPSGTQGQIIGAGSSGDVSR